MQAFEGVFLRGILSHVEGPCHVGRHIGIPHCHVDHVHSHFLQFLHKPYRFRQILGAVAFLSEATALRVTVIDSETGGHHEAVILINLCRPDGVLQKPCAVFVGSAVEPWTGVRRGNLLEEVAMTGLDVDCIKACLLCKACALPEVLFSSLKVIITHDTAVIGCPELLQVGVPVGNERGRFIVRIGVPA